MNKGLDNDDGEEYIKHKRLDEDCLLTLDLLSLKDDEFGQSALLRAIHLADISTAQLLINAKANVNEIGRKESLLYSSWRVHDHAFPNLLLHNGAIPYAEELENCRYPQMETTYRIMCARVTHCRAVTICLLAFRFPGPQDCHVNWIKKMIWSTRHNECWAPDWKMPPGFD